MWNIWHYLALSSVISLFHCWIVPCSCQGLWTAGTWLQQQVFRWRTAHYRRCENVSGSVGPAVALLFPAEDKTGTSQYRWKSLHSLFFLFSIVQEYPEIVTFRATVLRLIEGTGFTVILSKLFLISPFWSWHGSSCWMKALPFGLLKNILFIILVVSCNFALETSPSPYN